MGLAMASASSYLPAGLSMPMLFAGFMLFNFMTNVGPNAQTYLLAGEVFPVAIRGRGAGFATAVGKGGAVLTSFFFPILLKEIGIPCPASLPDFGFLAWRCGHSYLTHRDSRPVARRTRIAGRKAPNPPHQGSERIALTLI